MALVNEESLVPNSHKFKQENTVKEEKNIKKIAQGKRRKKSLGRKFSETFIKSDIEDVRGYIFFDVLVPAIVDTFRDMINSGLDMFLYGDARRSSRSSTTRGKSYVSYRDYYSQKEPRSELTSSRSRRRKEINNEVIFNSRGEAEDVVDAMLELLDKYEMVSLREFYELVDLDFEFTDEKYGWTNLRDVSVSRIRNGYVINLPRPVLLD